MHINERSILERFKSEIKGDLLFNYGSLLVMVASGLAIDLYIATYHGPRLFGMFNQITAIYLVTTQISVGGIHFSVAKYLAEYAKDTEESTRIFYSGFLLTLIISFSCSILLFVFRYIFAGILEPGSSDMVAGFRAISFSVMFFSLNKVILSALNGQKRMRTFAVAQSLRYILIAFFVIVLPIISHWGGAIVYSYLAAETLLFIFLSAWVVNKKLFGSLPQLKKLSVWAKRHLSFGARGVASGFLVEANTRVDIIMLGLFCDDRTVGIYSLASRIAEGFLNLIVVLKRNINPVLVGLVAEHNFTIIRKLVRRTFLYVYPISLACGIILYLIFNPMVKILGLNEMFFLGRIPLAILLSGIIVSSGLMVFDNILMQAGFPGLQTLLFGATVLFNIALNAFLIPKFALPGAAFATALSYLFSVAFLSFLTRAKIGLNLVGHR